MTFTATGSLVTLERMIARRGPYWAAWRQTVLRDPAERPFADPAVWASFSYTGA